MKGEGLRYTAFFKLFTILINLRILSWYWHVQNLTLGILTTRAGPTRTPRLGSANIFIKNLSRGGFLSCNLE